MMPSRDSSPLYLALDQGGHASRAIVFDAQGRAQARALCDVQVFHPQPDWVEQDPEELVASLNTVIREVQHKLGPDAANIVAAGLATQRSSIVCWDRITGSALSPVISWQDRRAHEWLSRFASQAEAVHRATGLRLSAHYGASKLRWCLDHLPRVAQAAAERRLAFGPLASFLVFRLTEERSLLCDPANAARTLLFNLEQGAWDEGLLHLFGVPRAALPEVVATRFHYGQLAASPDVPLKVVNGDQSAALFAYGAPQAPTAYLNMGTGAFVQRSAGHYPGYHPQLLTGIVLHDSDEHVYVLEGTVNGAGSALTWIGAQHELHDIEGQLGLWLARGAAGVPLFLNGIAGLGAPFWVADFASRFVSDNKTTAAPEPWQQVVAVAESIVFLVQANLDAFQKLASPVEQIVASGGLTHNDVLCQRLSDLSGLPLYRPAEHEATARGLAWLLAGKPHNWPEDEMGLWFKPRPSPGLRARYTRWQREMEQALTVC